MLMKPSAAASTPVGTQRLEHAFYAVGLALMLTVALYFAHVVIVPLALSALFAFILSTPAEWVEKRGLGRVAGVLIVTFGAFALLAGVIAIASAEIHNLSADLPQYEENIHRKTEPIQELMKRFERLKSNFQEATPPALQPDGSNKPTPVVVQSPGESTLAWVPSLAMPLVELLVNGVLVVVLTVFMLMQRESFRDRLIRLAGRSRLSGTTRAVQDAAARVGKYLLLQLLINATLGVVIGIALWLIGVPYAPLWAMLVTILRFVPYVGYWMAGVGAIAMSAAVSPGWTQPLVVVGLFAVLDLVMANVIEPLVFSHGTGVSPVALLIAAVFWAFLWGPVGLLLSTPLTVCLAVLGKHVPALGFLTIILGDEPSLDAAARYYNRMLARDYDEAAVLLDEYRSTHPIDQTYDEVILPALAQVKTDREQQDVNAEEERAVYEGTQTLLEGMGASEPQSPETANDARVRIVGCAVFGQADTLALRMLGDAVEPLGVQMIIARPQEVIHSIEAARATDGKLPKVCLSTLSPGGLSQARAIIGEVRRRFPDAQVLVGRWGQTGDTNQTDKYLRTSGADAIGWTLRETIKQLLGTAPVAKAA